MDFDLLPNDVGRAHLKIYSDWLALNNSLVDCVPDRATNFVDIMRACLTDPLRSEAFFSPPYLLHKAVAKTAPNGGQAEVAFNAQVHQFFTTVFTELEQNLNGILFVHDQEQRTPLHIALETGNVTLMNFFIHRGSPIDIFGSNGTVATTKALKTKNQDILEFLIKRGAGFHFMFPVYETTGYENILRFVRRKAPWMFWTARDMYHLLKKAITAKERELRFPWQMKGSGPIMNFCSQCSDIGSIDFRWFIRRDQRLVMSLYRVVWNYQEDRFEVLDEKVRLRRSPLMQRMGSYIGHEIRYAGGTHNYLVPESTVNSLVGDERFSSLRLTLSIDLREIPVNYFVVCKFVKV